MRSAGLPRPYQPSWAVMLALRCPRHPVYRGIRKPRANCADCIEMYQRQDPDTRMPEFGFTRAGDGTWYKIQGGPEMEGHDGL